MPLTIRLFSHLVLIGTTILTSNAVTAQQSAPPASHMPIEDLLDEDEQCSIPATQYSYGFKEREWKIITAIEAQLGGKTLTTVELENGRKETMHAGDGVQFGIGALYRSFKWQKDIGFKLGYLYDKTTVKGTELSNGYLQFSRHTAELYIHQRTKRHRYGLGIAYHYNNQFTARTNKVFHAHFDNSFGVVAEYLYDFPSSNSLLGFRYIRINYKIDDKNYNQTVDGSGFGIAYRYYF